MQNQIKNTGATQTKNTIEEKRERIKREASEQVVEPINFPPRHISELYKKQFPEQTWLVDSLVPANAVTIFSASPGSYKTRSLLHLAVCVSKGEPLFGEFATTQSGVLIIDEESGEPLLQKQLQQLGATDDLPIYYRSFQNFKLNRENIENVVGLDCFTHKLKVVIFDSLIQIHNAEENDASQMAPVMNFLKQLAESGLTVLVIAHDRKTGMFGRKGNSELRGSSAILGGVDAHISLLKKGERLVIEPTKLRHAPLHEAFEVIVSGDDSHCSFEFQGLSKTGDNTAIKAAITNKVQECAPINQQTLLSGLNDSGTKVGETKLREILKVMEEEATEIDYYPGTGKEKLYIPAT